MTKKKLLPLFIGNRSTSKREIHKWPARGPCLVTRILLRNLVIYVGEKEMQAAIEKEQMDMCAWCFGKEKSKH